MNKEGTYCICDILHVRRSQHPVRLGAGVDEKRPEGHVLCAGDLVAHVERSRIVTLDAGEM